MGHPYMPSVIEAEQHLSPLPIRIVQHIRCRVLMEERQLVEPPIGTRTLDHILDRLLCIIVTGIQYWNIRGWLVGVLCAFREHPNVCKIPIST
jgi:hypothetical protein